MCTRSCPRRTIRSTTSWRRVGAVENVRVLSDVISAEELRAWNPEMAEEMAKVAKDIQAPKGEARLPAAKSPQAAKLLRRSSASTVSPNVAGDLEVMEEDDEDLPDPKAAFRAANDAHQAVQTRRLHSATSMAAVAATTRTRRRSRNRPRNASTIASIPKTPSCWTFWRAFQEQLPGRAHPCRVCHHCSIRLAQSRPAG